MSSKWLMDHRGFCLNEDVTSLRPGCSSLVTVCYLAVCVVALNQFSSSTSRVDAVLYSSASLQEEMSLCSYPQKEMKRRRRAPQSHSSLNLYLWGVHVYHVLPSQTHPSFHNWTHSWVETSRAVGLWLNSSKMKMDSSHSWIAVECRRSCEHRASCNNDWRLMFVYGALGLFCHAEKLKWAKPDWQEPETHSCSTSAPAGSQQL